ncbi:MAG: site-2 protease family protein [Candidatus Diapherotrites archaeon]
MAEFEWLYWLAGFLIVSVIITYILKRRYKQQTFVVGTIYRTTRPLKWIDALAKKLSPVLDAFADIGLILGFGAIAADYLYGRGKGAKKRLLVFLISFVFLSAVLFIIDFSLNGFISSNPLTRNYTALFYLFFWLFGFAGFVVFWLGLNAFDIIVKMLAGKQPCPGVGPLIPGVEIPNIPIVVPLHAWISILIILIIHEGMHGVTARKNGFSLKSTGLLLLGFLPIGAFVEPDEKQVAKAEPRQALRLFAAGPMANVAAFFLTLLLILGIASVLAFTYSPWAAPIKMQSVKGIEVKDLNQSIEICGETFESPLYGKIQKGDLIEKIDGQSVYSASGFVSLVEERKGKEASITFDRNGTTLTEGFFVSSEWSLGFKVKEIKNEAFTPPPLYNILSTAIDWLGSFLFWFLLLNFLVAIGNFLPLDPFDGGRIAKMLFLPYFAFLKMPKEDTEKFIGRLMLWLVLILIALNALPLFF